MAFAKIGDEEHIYDYVIRANASEDVKPALKAAAEDADACDPANWMTSSELDSTKERDIAAKETSSLASFLKVRVSSFDVELYSSI